MAFDYVGKDKNELRNWKDHRGFSLPNFHKSLYSDPAARPFWFWTLIMKKYRLMLSYRSPYGMLENIWLSFQKKKKEKKYNSCRTKHYCRSYYYFFNRNADINVVIKIESTWSRCLRCWILSAMRILNCKEEGELSISQQNDWHEQYNFPKEDNAIFFSPKRLLHLI